jgi:xanthine dehydrogenase small subunit
MGEVLGRHVVTIEGLNQAELSPVQKALVDEGAIQCGFCTPGLVIALTSFLLSGAPVSTADGIAALGGNICRCTGYTAIRRAIARLCDRFPDLQPGEKMPAAARVAALVARGVLPGYFLDVPALCFGLGGSGNIETPDVKAAAPPSVLVAGGTDLFVTQAESLQGSAMSFLSRRLDLQGVSVDKNTIRIGAATPVTAIAASSEIGQLVPDLCPYFVRISAQPIRNRATVAGNIVNASPAGDLSVMFLALDATLILGRGEGRREIQLRDFFRGYKVLDLAPDEMILEIRFPVPETGTRFHFEKVARREHMDIASVSSAIRLRVRGDWIVEAHAAAGGVAPVPLYLRRTVAFLQGQSVSEATARTAAELARAEISPISDVRGSADYKRALLGRLVAAHFLVLFPERIREESFA